MTSNPPQYVQPPDDPAYLALKQKAQDDQAAATSDTVRMDSASLLARYGTLVSLANAGSPAAPGSPVMPSRSVATGALPPISRVG